MLIFERESERVHGRGRGRGTYRIWSKLQALSCQHSPMWGSNPWAMRLWPELKLDIYQLSHPGTPNFFYCLFLREKERQSASRREERTEGDTESEAGSRIWAVSTEPDAGLELTDREIMTWAEVWRLTDWATQAPHELVHSKEIIQPSLMLH